MLERNSTDKDFEDTLVIDKRAKGNLKLAAKDSFRKGQLLFEDFSRHTVKEKYFFQRMDLERYLSKRIDVDTWEITDERTGHISYYHREPSGELEHFTSESTLNYVLAQEGGGYWEINYTGDETQTPTYMLDTSSWWKRQYTAFASIKSFQQACRDHEQKQRAWFQKVTFGLCSMVMAPLFYPLFNSYSTTQDANSNVSEEPVASIESSIFEPFSPLPSLATPWQILFGYYLSTQLSQTMVPHHSLNSLVMQAIGITLVLPQILAQENTFVEQVSGAFNGVSESVILTDDTAVTIGTIHNEKNCNNVATIKLADNGTLLEAKSLGGTFQDCLYSPSITATTDGNLVVAASTTGFGSMQYSFYIVKLTDNGKVLWGYTLARNYNWVIDSTAITASSDNSVVLAGYINDLSADSRKAISLSKLSNEGDLKWSYTFNFPKGNGLGSGAVKNIVQNTDGSFVLTGYIDSYINRNPDVLVVKFSAEAELLWIRSIGQSEKDYGYGVTLTTDGNIFVAGSSMLRVSSNVYTASFLSKWKADGTLSWAQIFRENGPHTSINSGVLTTNNNEIVATGTADGRFLLTKWFSNGTLIWGTTVNDIGRRTESINLERAHNNFFSAGYDDSTGYGIFAKLNQTGGMLQCKNVQPLLPFPYWEVQRIKVDNSVINYTRSPVTPVVTNILSLVSYTNISPTPQIRAICQPSAKTDVDANQASFSDDVSISRKRTMQGKILSSARFARFFDTPERENLCMSGKSPCKKDQSINEDNKLRKR